MKDLIASLKAWRAEIGKEAAEAAVQDCFNCCVAEFGDDGWVWIAEPARGHWLSPDELDHFWRWVRLRDWLESR